MSEELKPCPFYGSKVELRTKRGLHITRNEFHCPKCNSAAGAFALFLNPHKAWNARAIEDSLRRERDEARAEIERLKAERSKVNNFDVLKEMGERNLDIRGFPLMSNLVSANLNGANGVIKMTVNPETVRDLLVEKSLIGMLIIADADQFNHIKAELETSEKNMLFICCREAHEVDMAEIWRWN